jgi:hypothetical protein
VNGPLGDNSVIVPPSAAEPHIVGVPVGPLRGLVKLDPIVICLSPGYTDATISRPDTLITSGSLFVSIFILAGVIDIIAFVMGAPIYLFVIFI